MQSLARLFAGFSILIVLLLVASAYFAHRADFEFDKYTKNTPVVLNDSVYWLSNSGHILSNKGESVFTAQDFETSVTEKSGLTGDYLLYWFNQDDSFCASALGSDDKQHFVPGYLSNFQPFETEHIWVPLKTLAMKKRYMYDHEQYNGYKDVWQYSVEGYTNTIGDCEDHSIVLCDWLLSLGYETRVAVGTYDKQGHAWVVLYKDNKEFILEATQKSNLGRNAHYPLAALVPQYKPVFMFDQLHIYRPNSTGERSHEKSKWHRSTSYLRNKEII